ncbi:MAG: cysteine-rich CWC family protein [Sphingobacteriales bacterium]
MTPLVLCKHEVISCERCSESFECKANAVTKCQCIKVHLTLNETQYVNELYDGCLCVACLSALKEEYLLSLLTDK